MRRFSGFDIQQSTFLLLLFAGCLNPFASDAPVPANAVSMTPSPAWGYPAYWAQVEADAGQNGDYDRIEWYLVPNGPWAHGDNATIRGLWMRRGHRIYIANGFQRSGPVIRHEMLHDLLDDPSHRNPLFAYRAYDGPGGPLED
jgi:hypothetical protein